MGPGALGGPFLKGPRAKCTRLFGGGVHSRDARGGSDLAFRMVLPSLWTP